MLNKQNGKKTFFNKAIIIFFVLFALVESVLYFYKRGDIYLPANIASILDFVMITALTLLLINLLLRFTVGKIFSFFEDEMEIEQRIFISKLYSILIYAIGISFIIYRAGVQITEITIFLGLVATGIAFAIRDIILSFFAWLIILTKKPIRIKDVISVGDEVIGQVDRIGTFFITLKKADKTLIKIPNKNLLDKHTQNYGKSKLQGQIMLPIKKYPSDMEKTIISLSEKLGEFTKINVDSDGKDFFLTIQYSVDFKEEREFRTRLILTAQKQHPKIFKNEKE